MVSFILKKNSNCELLKFGLKRRHILCSHLSSPYMVYTPFYLISDMYNEVIELEKIIKFIRF